MSLRERPDDFPQRLERLRASSGQCWRSLARELPLDSVFCRQFRLSAA